MKAHIATITVLASACASSRVQESQVSCSPAEVSLVPPDTLPAWFNHDSSWGGGYLKHVIAVRFDSTASTAQRGAAVAAVCGRVVGGWRMGLPGDGFYAVQIDDEGDRERKLALIEKIRAMPKVVSASEEPLVSLGPDIQ